MNNGSFFHKEKWWLAAFAVVIPVINHVFNIGLDGAHLAAIIIPIIALIVGDAWIAVQLIRLEHRKLNR